MQLESNHIIFVKIFDVPATFLKALPQITTHSLSDTTVTMSLAPNFDLSEPKVPKKLKNKETTVTVLNLVFDQLSDSETVQPASQIGGDKLSFISQRHLANLERFSRFVMTSALPKTPQPEDFKISVESLLTQREWDILRLVYMGYSSKKIAAARNLSHRTIELHRQNCAQKIGTITPLLLAALFSNSVLDTYSWTNSKTESLG